MDSVNLLKYISANLLVANPDKTQFLIAGGEKGGRSIRVGSALIERSDDIELLRMKVKEDFSFNKHIKEVIRALNQRTVILCCLAYRGCRFTYNVFTWKVIFQPICIYLECFYLESFYLESTYLESKMDLH
jgi:hypothetical protein